MQSYLEYLSLLLGALLISFGGALTGIYTFESKFLPVFTGYLLFTVGYKLSWHGTHTLENLEDVKEVYSSAGDIFISHVENEFRNYYIIVFGLILSSLGTVQFGDMVVNGFEFFRVVWAGILCFGGYMVAHEGVNEVLV